MAGHCYDLYEHAYQPDNSDARNCFGQVKDRTWHGVEGDVDTPDTCYMSQDRGVTYYLGTDDGGTDHYIAGTIAWDQVVDMYESGLDQMG